MISCFSLSAWLSPLSVICSNSIQDVANGNIWFFSHGWVMFHPIYMPHLLKPIYWWALGLFPCLGYCELLLWTLGHKCFFKSEFFFFSFLDIYPGVGLLVHMVALFLVFKATFILLSIVASPIYIPTNSVGGSLFSTSSPVFIICRLFMIAILTHVR